jgi:hypothetical protein
MHNIIGKYPLWRPSHKIEINRHDIKAHDSMSKAPYAMEDDNNIIVVMTADQIMMMEKRRMPSDETDDGGTTSTTVDDLTPSTTASHSPFLPPSNTPMSSPPPKMLGGGGGEGGECTIRYEGRRHLLDRLGSVPSSYFLHGNDDDEEEASSCSSSSSFRKWRIPASKKSQRTRNPIRAIVDPIMAAEQSRMRGDGGGNADGGTTVEKDQISLAVSPRCCISCVFASVFIPRHPVGCADENTQ